MKKHPISILFFLLLSSQITFGQLGAHKKEFTEADSLRGTLNEFRSCFDVTFYRLTLRISPADSTVSGMASTTFKVVKNTKRIQLDLFSNMNIQQVLWQNKQIQPVRKFNAVFIDFPEELKAGTIQTVSVMYNGQPQVAKSPPWDGGFVWKKNKDGKPWVNVACQGTGASLWWPCKDHQSDEPDSMLISIACPSDLMNVSNGRLRNVRDYENGWKQYDWFVSNPINTYNVTVNIGPYVHFGDTLGKLTLDYFVMPENLEKAKVQFQQVKPMMKCFEKLFGPYPFYDDGYKLVESWHLGMEHQSAVAYGNKYKNGYLGHSISDDEGQGEKFDYIIIHETAHEWFGNSITTADIADMWVHEGFGVYAEALYLECMYGYNDYLKYVSGLRNSIGNRTPVIGPYDVNEEGSGDMYNKGALMMHTIRYIVNNDSLFLATIHSMCIDYYHSIVTSQEIENYWIKKTGIDLKNVFNQYLRYNNPPMLELKKENEQVLYRWKCDVANFNQPCPVIINGTEKKKITPTDEWQILSGVTSTEDVKLDKDYVYYKVNRL